MNLFKRKAEEEKRRKAEAARRQMELEFEQMEIENKISNSGLEERSSVSPAKKTSSHFDKRKFREDSNKMKLNNLKSKRKNPTYSGIKLIQGG